MLHTHKLIRTSLFCVALASAAGAFAADSGITGTGSFKPPGTAGALPSSSPFSVEDLASGQVSFAIRWDDAAPDRDPDPYRGFYPGAIRKFVVRIGATEIALPADDASIEVSDGGSSGSHQEFVKLQASQVIAGYRLSVGWMTLNEIVKTGDLRGTTGFLASDALPNGETLAALKPAGRFDRSLFVTLRAESEPRSFPIYLQTSAIEVKPVATAAGTAR